MTTLNQNILFSGNNYLDLEDIIIHSSSEFEFEFPVSNLQTDALYEFARFRHTDKDNTWLIYDLSETKLIQLFAVIKHNFGISSKIRFRVFSEDETPSGTEDYDSGWINCFPVGTEFGDLDWGLFDWGGLVPTEFLNNYNKHFFLPLEESVIGRYIRIDFDDETDVSAREDNYLQAAKVYAGQIYQPSYNAIYGATIKAIDETKYKAMRSGTRIFSDLTVQRRAVSVTLENIPSSEFLYNIFGPLYMAKGKKTSVIVILKPLEAIEFPFNAIYGNILDSQEASYAVWSRMTNAIYVEELV